MQAGYHGAGTETQTLSDLVNQIECVDAHRILWKPEHEKKRFFLLLAGCFGLLGEATHTTFVLDEMRIAVMKLLELPLIEAISLSKETAHNVREDLKKLYLKEK
ncbi:hypothetical protein ED733_002519 [Metarhizium rileyi]|uniref:Uncharacterized protein n=1 Tax=Metarhizium rileyi (strain RCEF 4871) TaxID=1649241 RepID=A0A5C6G1H2_METRR|nr:hypothetical protein ED733_002519 [Metarhizium rileyi]